MPSVRRFNPVLGKDERANRREIELAEHLNYLLGLDLTGARVGVWELANGVTRISHGLGRTPQGFFVTSHTAAADIIDDRDTNPHTSRHLFVRSDTATNATLLIY